MDKGRNIIASETETEDSTLAEEVARKAKQTGKDVFTDDQRPKRQETVENVI